MIRSYPIVLQDFYSIFDKICDYDFQKTIQ